MSALVSMVATLQAIGFADGLIVAWGRAWVTSWMIAFPALVLVIPIVKKLIAKICRPK